MLLILPQPVPGPGSVTPVTEILISVAIWSGCSDLHSHFTACRVIYGAAYTEIHPVTVPLLQTALTTDFSTFISNLVIFINGTDIACFKISPTIHHLHVIWSPRTRILEKCSQSVKLPTTKSCSMHVKFFLLFYHTAFWFNLVLPRIACTLCLTWRNRYLLFISHRAVQQWAKAP